MTARLRTPDVNGRRGTWPDVEGLALPPAPVDRHDDERGMVLVAAIDTPGVPAVVGRAEAHGARLEILAPEGRRWLLVDEGRFDFEGENEPGAPMAAVPRLLVPWQTLDVIRAMRPEGEGGGG